MVISFCSVSWGFLRPLIMMSMPGGCLGVSKETKTVAILDIWCRYYQIIGASISWIEYSRHLCILDILPDQGFAGLLHCVE